MKHYLYILLLLIVSSASAQLPDDALRTAWFTQNGTARNMATGGVGLGLSIARDIAHNHGGDITLSSSKTHGGLKASLVVPY